jgi:hypothetical protein
MLWQPTFNIFLVAQILFHIHRPKVKLMTTCLRDSVICQLCCTRLVGIQHLYMLAYLCSIITIGRFWFLSLVRYLQTTMVYLFRHAKVNLTCDEDEPRRTSNLRQKFSDEQVRMQILNYGKLCMDLPTIEIDTRRNKIWNFERGTL